MAMMEREHIKIEHGFQQFRSIKIGDRKIKLAGLLAVVIFVVTAAAAGVVGNFAYAILPSLWNWLTSLEVNKVWLWIVVFLQLIVLLCTSYGWWQTSRRAKEE